VRRNTRRNVGWMTPGSFYKARFGRDTEGYAYVLSIQKNGNAKVIMVIVEDDYLYRKAAQKSVHKSEFGIWSKISAASIPAKAKKKFAAKDVPMSNPRRRNLTEAECDERVARARTFTRKKYGDHWPGEEPYRGGVSRRNAGKSYGVVTEGWSHRPGTVHRAMYGEHKRWSKAKAQSEAKRLRGRSDIYTATVIRLGSGRSHAT
jgi:hypothetical protein